MKIVEANRRFVFIHHLVGGSPMNNRGSVEVARLVKHGVSIVFHGHDHLFINQDLDGIYYQEVPQPGHPRSGNTNTAKEYGYLSGEIQSSSGYVRVRVGQDENRVDYVRTFLPAAESQSRQNGDISFSYTVRGSSNSL